MAIEPTTRDGEILRGITPSEWMKLSKPRLGRTVSIRVLTHLAMRKAMASQSRAAITLGMASAIMLSMFLAGSLTAST